MFGKLCPGLQSKIKRKKVLPSGHVVIVVPGIVTIVVILFLHFGLRNLDKDLVGWCNRDTETQCQLYFI